MHKVGDFYLVISWVLGSSSSYMLTMSYKEVILTSLVIDCFESLLNAVVIPSKYR